MSVPATKQAAFWGVASAVILIFIWMFKAILTPFVLGVVIAYLLNPLVKGFSTKGIQRTTSSVFIILLSEPCEPGGYAIAYKFHQPQ